MRIEINSSGEDLSGFDLDDEKLSARRLAEYSPRALKAGLNVDRLFINHPDFSTALTALDRIFQLAREVEVPHGMTLIGPSGTGKTSVLNYFRRSLPPSSLFSDGLGAVYLRVPMRCSTAYLISGLLRLYGYPFLRVTRDCQEARTAVLFDAMRQKGTRMVMLDEAHHLVPSFGEKRRTREEGTAPTDLVRQMIDEARVAVVLAGPGALDVLGEADEALASRVVGIHRLDRFKYDATWVGLVRAFAKQVPEFDLSVLMVPEINQQLFNVTDGNLRSLKRLITELVLLVAECEQRVAEPGLLARAYAAIYGAGRLTLNPFVAANA